jgi:hypothetical protein
MYWGPERIRTQGLMPEDKEMCDINMLLKDRRLEVLRSK